MQFHDPPRSRAFGIFLLRIAQWSELSPKRMLDSASQQTRIEERPVCVEVDDGNWEAWVEAGGDLLMGQQHERA
jgi:hypothetical protein